MEQDKFDELFPPLTSGLKKLLELGARSEQINNIIPNDCCFAIDTDDINLQLNTNFTPLEVMMAVGLLNQIRVIGVGNNSKYYRQVKN